MQEFINNIHLIKDGEQWIGFDVANIAIFELDATGVAFLQGDSEIRQDQKVVQEWTHYFNQGFFQDIPVQVNMESYLLQYSFSIQNTLLCPLNCSYCFSKKIKSEPKNMTLETANKVVDLAFQQFAGQADLMEFVFTSGGEPLVNFDVIQEVYHRGKDLGKKYDKEVRVGVTTNTMLLDEEKMKFFDESEMGIVMSVDGPPEDHDRNRQTYEGSGSYEAIVKAVSRVKKSPSYGISHPYALLVVTPEQDDYVKLVKHVVGMGFSKIIMKNVRNVDPDNPIVQMEDVPKIKESYRKLIHFLSDEIVNNHWRYMLALLDPNCTLGQIIIQLLLRKKSLYRCAAGKAKFSILPNGDIFPCDYYAIHPETKIGHVDSGISEEKRQEWFDDTCQNHNTCRDCWARYLCGGGCYYTKYINGGEPDEIYCEIIKCMIEESIRMINRLQKNNKKVYSYLVSIAKNIKENVSYV